MTISERWWHDCRPTPESLQVSDAYIDIWLYHLPKYMPLMDSLYRELAVNEKQRAKRLKIADKRQQFILARALMRRRLAQITGREPATLTVTTTVHGKPILADDKTLSFNLSHSHDLALLAVSRQQPIGIDIERIDPGVDHGALVRRFFSSPERVAFNNLPASMKCLAFYAGWTRKEAFIKAVGTPIRLGDFDVSLNPKEQQSPITQPGATTTWTAKMLPVSDQYMACVVDNGRKDHAVAIRYWRS